MLLTTVDKAVLVTSFTEFERAFGGLDDVGGLEDRTNYLAYAARAFFANGGRRLYVSRVFRFTTMPAAGGRERADRRPGEPDRSGLAGRAARCPRRDVRRHLPHPGARTATR